MIDVAEFDASDDEDDEPREAALCFRYALEFYKRGLNVVPRNPHKKCPAVRWKPLQDRRVTANELEAWRGMCGGGIGFITGAISKVIVIESDGPEGEAVIAEFEQAYGALPETFTVRSGSGRGLHRYYRHPGFRVPTRANTSIKLDVKGDAGFCVLPPSLHKSGGRYEIVSDIRPASLPEGLLEFIEAKAAEAKGATNISEAQGKATDIGSNTNLWGPLPVNAINVAIVASMLNALPDSFAINHDDWLRVGFALHDFDGGEVGLELWRKFSERCPEKAQATDFCARWASFDSRDTGNKITLGSLRHKAEKHGWRAPRNWDRASKL